MDPLPTLGFLGCGHWLETDAWQKKFKVIAVSSRNNEKAKEFARLFESSTATFEEVATLKGLQTIFVHLPTSLKCNWIIRCLKEGKNVITTLPVCSTAKEAKLIVNTIKKTQHTVSVLDSFIPVADISGVIKISTKIRLVNKSFTSLNPHLSGGAGIVIGSKWMQRIKGLFPEKTLNLKACQFETTPYEINYGAPVHTDYRVTAEAYCNGVSLHLEGELAEEGESIDSLEILFQDGTKSYIDMSSISKADTIYKMFESTQPPCDWVAITENVEAMYSLGGIDHPGKIKNVLRFNDPWDTAPGAEAIIISMEEQRLKRLTSKNLQLACLMLHTFGYVVLHNALPLDYVTKLREEFLKVYEDCSNTPVNPATWLQTSTNKKATFYTEEGRRRIFPKITPPFDEDQLVNNSFAAQILQYLMQDYYCAFLSSDSNQPGSFLQAPHRDTHFYNVENHHFYVVNVPLVDVNMENGPIEVWPVTHHVNWPFTNGMEIQDGWNLEMERVCSMLPSKYLQAPVGSIWIRQPGVWHRGTPNHSNTLRPLLTIGYAAKNYFMNYGTGWNWREGTPEDCTNPNVGKMFKARFFRY